MRRAPVAGAMLLVAGSVAMAQSARASLDVGSSGVRYADSINVAALALTPAFGVFGPRGFFGGTGTFSPSSGSSSYSGSLSGTAALWSVHRLSVEAGGMAGGSAHSDGSRTGQMLGTGRLNVNAGTGGAWGGAGLGRTWDGSLWRGVVQGSVGGWFSSSMGSAVLAISPTAVDDTITYSDAVLTLQRAIGALEVTGSFGARLGDPVPTLVTDRVWGSVSATAWMRRSLALVASAGTYPIDFTQGFPGGKFLTLAIRMATGRAAEAAPSVPVDITLPEVRAFEVRSVSGASRQIRVHAPTALSVEVAGDFSNWQPLALTADAAGWWTVTHTIAPGTHQINLRVNGGAWQVPPGLSSLPDEFGGASGLVVIPDLPR